MRPHVRLSCWLHADADYLAAFQHLFLPIAYEFSPDLIIVAAGYDAADGDPMGGCHVTAAGYAHMTALLKAVAPLAVILEGGYNLAATAAGVEATLRVLLGEQPPKLPQGPMSLPSRTAMMTISHAISIQVGHLARTWPRGSCRVQHVLFCRVVALLLRHAACCTDHQHL